MTEVDQYMRLFPRVVFIHAYSVEEERYFWPQFVKRWADVDGTNSSDLKKILNEYEWIKISEFGSQADSNAFLIVQHADHDRAFQKQVLSILEKLYQAGETKKSDYAYLFDRVACGETPPRLQRYGTQGCCVGVGRWEPHPMEDPGHVDQRRIKMEINPPLMKDYQALFVERCKKKEC